MRRFYFPLYVCFFCTFITAVNTNNTFTVPIIDTVAQAINTKNNTEKISPTEELKALQNNTDNTLSINENDIEYNENKDRENTETQEYNSLQQELSEESPVFYSYKTSTSDNLAALVEKLESLNQKSASLFFRENKLKSWHQEIADIIYYVRIINKKEHNKRLEQEAYKPLHAALKELTQALVTYEPLIIIPDITKILQESPYAILGVEKNATDEEIAAAYQNFYQQYTAEKIQQRMQQENASEKDIKREKKAGAIVLATIQRAYDKIKTAAARSTYMSQEGEEYSDQLSTESKNALQKITATLGRLLYSGQLLTQIEKFIKEYEPQELEKKKALTKSELERIGEEKVRLQQRPIPSQYSQTRDYGYGSGSDYYPSGDYGNYGGGSYGGGYDGSGYDPYSLTQPVSGVSDMGEKGGGGAPRAPGSGDKGKTDKDKEKTDKDKKEEAAKFVESKEKKEINKLFKKINLAHEELEGTLNRLSVVKAEQEAVMVRHKSPTPPPPVDPDGPPAAPIKRELSTEETDVRTKVERQNKTVDDAAKDLSKMYRDLSYEFSNAQIVQPGTNSATGLTQQELNDCRNRMNKLQNAGKYTIEKLTKISDRNNADSLERAINAARKSLNLPLILGPNPTDEAKSGTKNTPAAVPINLNQAEARSIKTLRNFEQAHTALEDALDNLEEAIEAKTKIPLGQSSIKTMKANREIQEQAQLFTQKVAELVQIYDSLSTTTLPQKEIALYKKVIENFEPTIKFIIKKLTDIEKLADNKNIKLLAQQLETAIDTFRKILGMSSILAPKEETDFQEDVTTPKEQQG